MTGVVEFDPDANAAGTINVSTYTNALVGGQAQLASVAVADGRPRTIVFRSDMLGQVFRRDERDALTSGDPHEVWHRYSGRQMGYVGNNGKADVDYASSVAEKQSPPGQSSFADFDLAYDAINAYEQGGRGGVYTVQAGDTLSSIASQLWGDASLWWKLAEINGLNAESTLVEGVLLIVPVGVQTNANNAATFQPYDPLEVLGNTSPTSPKPSHNKNCGGMGQVLVQLVAFAVALALDRFIPTLGQQVGAMIRTLANGARQVGIQAASNAVGQGVAIAAGVQEKFSWNQVGMAAVGSLVGQSGIGDAVASRAPGGQFVKLFVKGAAEDAITQGIGKATGMQESFSWAGVAAAGLSQAYVGKRIGEVSTAGKFAHAFAARTLIHASMRSLIEGDDFGDAMLDALPGAFTASLGNYLTDSAQARAEANAVADENADMYAAGWRMDSDGHAYRIGIPGNDHGYSNAAPGRGNLWDRFWGGVGDFLGGVGEFVGSIFGGDDDRANAPMHMAYDDQEVITITGPRRMPRQMRSASDRVYDPDENVRAQAFEEILAASRREDPQMRAARLYGPISVQYCPIGPQQSVRGYSSIDVWMQHRTQLGMQGITNSMTGTGASFQLGAGLTGAPYEEQVQWGALGSGLESSVGGMYGAQPFSAGRPSPSPYVFEYDFATVNGIGRRDPSGLVYLRVDGSGRLAPYGGQSVSYARFLERQTEHSRRFPNADFEFYVVGRANPGVELDVAEHVYIQRLTGGVSAGQSPLVSNIRNPVGPQRRAQLGLPEPRR